MPTHASYILREGVAAGGGAQQHDEAGLKTGRQAAAPKLDVSMGASAPSEQSPDAEDSSPRTSPQQGGELTFLESLGISAAFKCCHQQTLHHLPLSPAQ